MNKRKVLSILLLALITVTLAVSCSSNIETPVTNTEELAYVTFGNGHSRELGTSYETLPYDDLYWFYIADKDDNYGTTGETLAEKPVSATYGNQGEITNISSGLGGKVGPFSQGKWNFTLKAYSALSDENTGNNLVYESGAVNVTLKGGDVKNVPVSVSLKGESGKVRISNVKFYWANGGGTNSPVASLSFVGSNSSNFTVTAPSLNYVSATETEGAYFFLSVPAIPHGDDSSTTNIPADYYTVTANVYLPDSADTPLVTQIFGLRVYGNATTVITGDLTEGLDSYVLFDVAKQDMKVFVPSSTGTTKIENINVVPDTTTVTGVTKSTTVEFDEGALTAVANKTLQLDVKVTPVEAANNKFNITGTDQNNKSAFAGIDVTLWATDSTGSSEVNSFTEGKYATVTTYIAKGLTSVAVKYNGSDKDQPIATDSTEEGVDKTVATILSTDEGSNLGYNPTTGLLRFKTNHFSEYYVLADCVALNETTNVGYGDLQKAFDNAKDGETIRLYADCSYSSNGTGLWNIKESIILDGNGKTISGWGSRSGNRTTLAINNGGTEPISVNIKNLTINNTESGGRAIETRGYITSLTLDNVNINLTGGGNTQGLTIGGSQATIADIKIKNSTISVGDSGYSYISFNPATVTIENSTFNGYSSMYFKGINSSAGSNGTSVIATNSTFNSPNAHSIEGNNDFGVFVFEDKGVSITLTNCSINAETMSSAYQAVFQFNSNAERQGDVSVTIDGDQTKVYGVICMDSTGDWNGKITLINGTYNLTKIDDETDGFKYSDCINENIKVSVNGGTFSTDPSAYVPAFGYKIETTSDDKYVVSEAPLEINNAQDLMNFAASVNAGNDYKEKTIMLIADIDLAGKTWVPIGEGNRKVPQHVFKGTFEGNNHTIKNLSSNGYNPSSVAVNDDGDMLYAYGLFGIVEGATIRNVKFENISIDTAKTINSTNYKGDSVGAVVGYAFKNATITGCEVLSGSINGHDAVAGIIGRAYGENEESDKFEISNCKNYATIQATKGKVAGVIGITGNLGNSRYSSIIQNCENRGTITGNKAGTAGIIAYVNKNTTINSCHNYGVIGSSNDQYSGGIGGYVTGSNIEFVDCNNYATGTITASLDAGGIVGISTNISNIKNCENSGSICAGDNGYGGGIAGSTSQSNITECRNTASVYGKYAGGVIGVDAASTITNCSGGTADITSPAHTITFTGQSFTLSVPENKSSGRIIGAHQGAGPYKYTVLVLDDNNSDSNTIPTVGICGNFTTMPILKISSGTFHGDPLAGNGSTIILESSATWGGRAAGTYTRGGVTESSRIAEWTISNN